MLIMRLEPTAFTSAHHCAAEIHFRVRADVILIAEADLRKVPVPLLAIVARGYIIGENAEFAK
jgi:hypothetical protein